MNAQVVILHLAMLADRITFVHHVRLLQAFGFNDLHQPILVTDAEITTFGHTQNGVLDVNQSIVCQKIHLWKNASVAQIVTLIQKHNSA